MDCICQQFLAGAGLTEYEHRRIGFGNLFRRSFSDNLAATIAAPAPAQTAADWLEVLR